MYIIVLEFNITKKIGYHEIDSLKKTSSCYEGTYEFFIVNFIFCTLLLQKSDLAC